MARTDALLRDGRAGDVGGVRALSDRLIARSGD
jgi:hypothetical protein